VGSGTEAEAQVGERLEGVPRPDEPAAPDEVTVVDGELSPEGATPTLGP